MTDKKSIRTVAVYCSMGTQLPPDYYQAGKDVGKALAEAKLDLIYGGANKGLMGTVADAALEAGGRVIGVVPATPILIPHTHNGLTELVRTEAMFERKRVMYERADAFIALPGGYGTLDEIFEVLTLQKLGVYDKHVYFYNHAGFWNPMMQMLSHFIAMRTMNPEHLNYFTFVHTVPELMGFLKPNI